MGKYPDQFLPGFRFLLFQHILDILDSYQVNDLILDLNGRTVNSKLQKIVLKLDFYQLIFTRFNGKQNMHKFCAQWFKRLNIADTRHLEKLFRRFIDQLNVAIGTVSYHAYIYVLYYSLEVMKALFFFSTYFLEIKHNLIESFIELTKSPAHSFDLECALKFSKTDRLKKAGKLPVCFIKISD